MTTVLPIDQAQRDAILTEIERNMCVEAGAGTGKTTVMVGRIIETIRRGYAAIDELVVITFTEKAATELSSRMREVLEEARGSAVDPDEIQRFDQAIRSLHRARIETIHAFAASLLRERPVEAGLDPGFDVLDTLQADLSFDEAFRSWVNDQFELAPEALRTALNRGFLIDQLRTTAQTLHDHRYLLPLNPFDAPEPDLLGFCSNLESSVAELTDLMASCHDHSDAGYKQIPQLQRFNEMCQAAVNRRGRLERIILTFPSIKKSQGAQKNWNTPDDCRRQKQITKDLSLELEELKAELRSEAIVNVLPLIEQFVLDYAERRQQHGVAEFEDLLIWARNLLRDDLPVRHDFQNRFKCILVDEFQDTDPLQVEIVMYLCSDEQAGTDWRELIPSDGKLFVVGDPKQSIYRFRRADIAIYEQVKHEILSDGILRIQQNFRSVAGVIDWVNDLFSRIMTPAERVQPDYVPLFSRPDNGESNGTNDRPAVIVAHSLEPQDKAESIREAEADILAQSIRHIVEHDPVTIIDPSTQEERPAHYQDIAVLVPTRSNLDLLEDSFEAASIPYRHEGGKSFFQRQEVRDLIVCLRAVDDPTDAIAVVAALRSSAFGCSDAHLFSYASERDSFDYRVEPADGHPEITHALATLRELHEYRRTAPLPELVERVVRDTSLVEFALTLPNGGDQVAANLLKMIDQARAFSRASGAGLRAFVRWVDSNRQSPGHEADAAVSESTDNVVRIMTIHAAKGLEFPIVALANFHSGSTKGSTTIPDHDNRRLNLRIGSKDNGFETPDFNEASDLEKQHDTAEALRLFYVAATRARDTLLLPIAALPDKSKGLLSYIAEHVPEFDPETAGTEVDGHFLLDPVAMEPLVRDLPMPVDQPPDPDELAMATEQRDAWREELKQALAAGNQPLHVVTASSARQWDRESATSDDEPIVKPASSHGPSAGALIGSAVHNVLERVDLTSDRRALTRLARTVLSELTNDIDRFLEEVVNLAWDCLQSDLMQRAAAAPRFIREAAFALEMGGGHLIQGRMDLLFAEDDGLVIGDFKTDRVREADVERYVEHYREQAAVYAYATRHISSAEVREVVFLFARTGTERAFPVDDALLELGERLGCGPSAEFGFGEPPDVGDDE